MILDAHESKIIDDLDPKFAKETLAKEKMKYK
jgi:hypothetical protein